MISTNVLFSFFLSNIIFSVKAWCGGIDGNFLKLFTLGTRGFFLANVGRNRPEAKADATSGLPREKTSGPERFDLLFSLNFDLFLSYYVQTNHSICLVL